MTPTSEGRLARLCRFFAEQWFLAFILTIVVMSALTLIAYGIWHWSG